MRPMDFGGFAPARAKGIRAGAPTAQFMLALPQSRAVPAQFTFHGGGTAAAECLHGAGHKQAARTAAQVRGGRGEERVLCGRELHRGLLLTSMRAYSPFGHYTA